MLRVAINVSPLKTGHRLRGIGYYTKNLLETLKKDTSITIKEFEDVSQLKDVDVVHYPWFDFFFHTLPLRKRFPTIVTIHDTTPLIFPNHYPVGVRGKINFLFQKISLKSCKFIISDSQNSKKDIVRNFKIDEEKVEVIPLAADLKFRLLPDTKLLRIKSKYHLPDKFLLYVGDANWVKNIPFLIEGLKEIVRVPGLDMVKLVLVGGVFLKNVENINHPELESLKKVTRLIREYNLYDKVLRPGQIEDEDLVAFYNLATIYVQPSFYEGFGLPILQAFSCGKPVVSSKKGSLPEVGGNAAVYFDPNNLNQFKSIVLEILQNKSLQNKLSNLGLKQASKFSWEKVISDTKSVYKKALQK